MTDGAAPLTGMPPGLWAGPALFSRSNHIHVAQGIVKLPELPGEPPTYRAVLPLTDTAGNITCSLNALGQLAALVATTTSSPQPLALWLNHPGDGWLRVAQVGFPIEIDSTSVVVNRQGFLAGSGGGDGLATGLSNDGRLCFTVNVNGTFYHQPNARLKVDGVIRATWKLEIHGPVEGSGRLESPSGSAVEFSDQAYVGSSPGRLTVDGPMHLQETATVILELAGTDEARYDALVGTGTAALDGNLAVHLTQGFHPAGGDSFSVVRAPAIHGEFANAPDGARLNTFDGRGSFLVRYSTTNVLLAAYDPQPTPAPTAAARLHSLALDAFGDARVELTGTPGREYTLESSTNLMTWESAATRSTAPDGDAEFDVPIADDPQRFFRVLAP